MMIFNIFKNINTIKLETIEHCIHNHNLSFKTLMQVIKYFQDIENIFPIVSGEIEILFEYPIIYLLLKR